MTRMLIATEHLGRAGGMEQYVALLLQALVARGVTVHVLARKIDWVPVGVSAERLVWSDEHDPPDALAQKVVERACLAFRPDAAIAHNVMDAGVLSALRAAPRFAYHVHDHRPFCPNGDRVYPRTSRNCTSPLGKACVRHSLTDGCAYGPRPRTLTLIRSRERLRDEIAGADAVIVCSDYVAARTTESGVDPARVIKIPCFLADEAFASAPGPGGKSVAFAGRVVPQKGLDALIRSLAHVPGERRPLLRVFGDGPGLGPCRRLAGETGVRMIAEGFADQATIRDALDEAALFALPSQWGEPFAISGIEAFARGRPVVAFATGGVGEWLINKRNGIAIEPGDERGFGNAIARLVEDVPLRVRLGEAARVDAERYRIGPNVDRLVSAYASLSGGSRLLLNAPGVPGG